MASGGPRQASPLRLSRPNHRAGPSAKGRGRPADLPTCRPADLPTCRIWVLDFSHRSEVSPPSTPRPEISPQVFSLDHAGPPKAQHLSERLLRCYCSAQSSSILIFPLETAITTSSNQKRYET